MRKPIASNASSAPSEMIEELLIAEQNRHKALIFDDAESFQTLMAENIVHVHTTGNVHNKTELIHHTGTFLKFTNVERGELTIRALSADIAVMTGEMINTVGKRGTNDSIQVRAFVTQVWQKFDGAWKTVTFQATRLGD